MLCFKPSKWPFICICQPEHCFFSVGKQNVERGKVDYVVEVTLDVNGYRVQRPDTNREIYVFQDEIILKGHKHRMYRNSWAAKRVGEEGGGSSLKTKQIQNVPKQNLQETDPCPNFQSPEKVRLTPKMTASKHFWPVRSNRYSCTACNSSHPISQNRPEAIPFLSPRCKKLQIQRLALVVKKTKESGLVFLLQLKIYLLLHFYCPLKYIITHSDKKLNSSFWQQRRNTLTQKKCIPAYRESLNSLTNVRTCAKIKMRNPHRVRMPHRVTRDLSSAS